MAIRLSYPHNVISYMGKTSPYWNGTLKPIDTVWINKLGCDVVEN